MNTFNSTNQEIIAYVKTWGDLKRYILPSIATFIAGILLLLIQAYFLAIILLLTGPCMMLCTYLEISKAIRKDKERGFYCSECDGLLRQRYISWVDDGAMCDGIDYYCYTCKEAKEVKTDINTNSQCHDGKKHVKKGLSPSASVMVYPIIIMLFLAILIGVPLCCVDAYFEWQKAKKDKDFSAIKGKVVKREPIIYKGIIPGVDFSIKIENSDIIVHAYAQRYLMSEVADEVDFHYSGNPNKEVFLMDYEDYPFWEFIICLFGTVFITIPLLFCIVKGYFISWSKELITKIMNGDPEKKCS